MRETTQDETPTTETPAAVEDRLVEESVGCMAATFSTGLPLEGPDPEWGQSYGETALAARDRELSIPRSHLEHSHTAS